MTESSDSTEDVSVTNTESQIIAARDDDQERFKAAEKIDDTVNEESAITEPRPAKKPKLDEPISESAVESAEVKEIIDQPVCDGDGVSLKVADVSSTCSTTREALAPSLSEHLHTVLSNLYLNVNQRLQLPFEPRCSEDLSFCHRHHYRAPAPQRPTHTQMHRLKCTLEQNNYGIYIAMTTEMCYRLEFPDDSALVHLMELILSINPRGLDGYSVEGLHIQCEDVFKLFVTIFPPCWLSMRVFYVNLLKRVPNPAKIAQVNTQIIPTSSKLFEYLLDLLEHTIDRCSVTELQRNVCTELPSKSRPEMTNSDVLNDTDGHFNPKDWEEQNICEQTFEALDNDDRLERLFIVLHLLLQILEKDLVMWMLHHYKSTNEWMFCPENSPLCAVMFEIPRFMRMTPIVRRLFTVFGLAVSKELPSSRLKVLERYISLLMTTSNVSDMEHTVVGVKYPYLGSETRSLIKEFFTIFKKHNVSKVSAYLNTINILHIPFVRYEFIDRFLQFFNFPSVEPLTPAKIVQDMAKKRWAKNPSSAELEAQSSVENNLSREQYLNLLLMALQAYCEWHGTRQLFTLIMRRQKEFDADCFYSTTNSVHRFPVQGNCTILLEKLAEDTELLEKKVKLTVNMRKPKTRLPLAEICIDKPLITKYRTDLTYIVNLRERIIRLAATNPEMDFTSWLDYLKHFVST